MKKKKVKTIGQLKKIADIVFSLWIRKRDGQCFTCGSKKNLQNGHYISRAKNITRYDEENCHAQCVGCNVFRYGNMVEYTHRLGWELSEKLRKKGEILHQFKRADLEEIIKKYS